MMPSLRHEGFLADGLTSDLRLCALAGFSKTLKSPRGLQALPIGLGRLEEYWASKGVKSKTQIQKLLSVAR